MFSRRKNFKCGPEVLKDSMDTQVDREGVEGGKKQSEGAQAWYFYVTMWMEMNLQNFDEM